MSDNFQQGIVYVLSNSAMPNLVKIGVTTRESLDDRMRELYTTSVPVPFNCEYACRVADCKRVEDALHMAFDPQRINPQREFFDIRPEQAIAVLKLLSIEEITQGVAKEIEKTANQIDLDAGKRLKRKKRPRFNFAVMGIPTGAQLSWKHGDEIAIVAGETAVRFNNDEMSLTRLTSYLLESQYDVQPGPHWLFDGRSLSDIYDETYTADDEP